MDTRSAVRAAKRVIDCKYLTTRALYSAPTLSFSLIRLCVVVFYDVDNDCFHVTVSLAAGREVSSRRRLARNDA